MDLVQTILYESHSYCEMNHQDAPISQLLAEYLASGNTFFDAVQLALIEAQYVPAVREQDGSLSEFWQEEWEDVPPGQN